jgi:hypothetical protein
MKTSWDVEFKRHAFFTSALYGGEWSASLPGERDPGTHQIGGWVDSRVAENIRQNILDF